MFWSRYSSFAIDFSNFFFPKALKSCLEKKVTKSFIAAELPWVCPTAIQKSLSSEPPAVGTFPRVLKHTKVTDTSEMHLGLNLMIYYWNPNKFQLSFMASSGQFTSLVQVGDLCDLLQYCRKIALACSSERTPYLVGEYWKQRAATFCSLCWVQIQGLFVCFFFILTLFF